MSKLIEKHPILLALIVLLILTFPYMYLRDYTPAVELPLINSLGGFFNQVPVIALSLLWFVFFFALIIGILDKFTTLIFSRRELPKVRFATALMAGAAGLCVWVVCSCFIDSLVVLWLVPLVMAVAYLLPTVNALVQEVTNRIVGLLIAVVAALCFFVPSIANFLPLKFLGSPWLIASGAILFIGALISVRLHDRTQKGIRRLAPAMPVLAISGLVAIFLTSFLAPEINEWTGYARLSTEVEDSADIYTLSTPGAKYLHIYTGREVEDFGDDVDAFIMSSPREGKLIVKTSFMGRSEKLQKFLEGQEFSVCGPYTIYSINKPTRSEAKKQKRQDRRKEVV